MPATITFTRNGSPTGHAYPIDTLGANGAHFGFTRGTEPVTAQFTINGRDVGPLLTAPADANDFGFEFAYDGDKRMTIRSMHWTKDGTVLGEYLEPRDNGILSIANDLHINVRGGGAIRDGWLTEDGHRMDRANVRAPVDANDFHLTPAPRDPVVGLRIPIMKVAGSYSIPSHLSAALASIRGRVTRDEVLALVKTCNKLTVAALAASGGKVPALFPQERVPGGGAAEARRYDPIDVIVEDCDAAENVAGEGNGCSSSYDQATAIADAKRAAEEDALAQMDALRPRCPPGCPFVTPMKNTPAGAEVVTFQVPIVSLDGVMSLWVSIATASWEAAFVCSNQAIG